MKLNISFRIIVALISVLAGAPVFAQQNLHGDCGGNSKIEINNKGEVNEATLQTIIANTKKELLAASLHHGRGARLSFTRPLKRQLDEFYDAMQDLHDQMYKAGCKDAKHGSSLEARVEVLEKQLTIN